jgi:DNA-directed RNA polymerase specialized sigma24 family protein
MSNEKSKFWNNEEIENAIGKYNETADDKLYAEVLYPAFVGMATRLFYSIGGHPNDEKDAVQEAIIRITNVLPRFEPSKSKAITWITAVIRNCFRNRKRNLAKQFCSEPFDGDDAFIVRAGLFSEPEIYASPDKVAQFVSYWRENASRRFKTKKQTRVIHEILQALESGSLNYISSIVIAKRARVTMQYVLLVGREMAALTPSEVMDG